MFKITSHVPKKVFSVDAINFLNILRKHKLGKISNALANNYCLNNVPPLTFVLMHYNNILGHIHNKTDSDFIKSFDIISNFSTKTYQNIYLPYHIPKFNLFHIGSICHLNSCLSILSSLTELIKEINEIVLRESIPNSSNVCISKGFKILNQYLINSYSQIDLNPNLLFELISVLNINPNELGEASETMKKILRVLYENGIKKSTILFWDSTDEFYDSDLSLGAKISHLNPKYLIVNSQDMNTLFDLNTDKIKIKHFNVPDKKGYALISLASFYSNHIVSVFNIDNNTFKIINDLHDRYHEETIDSKTLFTDKGSHVLACYLSDDCNKVCQ